MVKFCTTLSLNNIPEKPNKKHTNQQSEANVVKSKKLHKSESIWCLLSRLYWLWNYTRGIMNRFCQGK